jgi:hypothetical protein
MFRNILSALVLVGGLTALSGPVRAADVTATDPNAAITEPGSPDAATLPPPHFDCRREPWRMECHDNRIDCRREPWRRECRVDCDREPWRMECRHDCGREPWRPECRHDCDREPWRPECHQHEQFECFARNAVGRTFVAYGDFRTPRYEVEQRALEMCRYESLPFLRFTCRAIGCR